MLQRGLLKKEKEFEDSILRSEPIWFDVYEMKDSIFNEVEDKAEDEGEKIDVDIEYVCFSDVFNFSETGQEVIKALSTTADLSLFQRKSVRIMIDHKWNEIRHQSVRRLMFPYFNYLLTYWCWG